MQDVKAQAFISYAHVDAHWVQTLAANLETLGVRLFLDSWDILPGDLLVHRLDDAIREAHHGILVVSAASLTRPWVREEYAAMLTRSVTRDLRLIPVLLEATDLPPFLASRACVDFRNVDGPLYFQRVRELARLLSSDHARRANTSNNLRPPPGTGFSVEGSIRGLLTVNSRTTSFSVDDVHTEDSTPQWSSESLDLLRSWQDGGSVWGAARDGYHGASDVGAAERRLAELGAMLSTAFVPPVVVREIGVAVERAERLGQTLEFGIRTDSSVPQVPWELLTISVGGRQSPVALHPRVNVYREIHSDAPALAIQIHRPLRILVAIGSPEIQNERGELLDMEAELRSILDAVEPGRRGRHAAVRILETGSLNAIREALEQDRYHVLYLSCHARPGELILENDHGGEDVVTTRRLWAEGIPAGRGVPLVVLAGCSTARIAQDLSPDEGLASLAAELITHGVPNVIAMQARVGDKYATALAAQFFSALVRSDSPSALTALSDARRRVERERRNHDPFKSPPPEWPTAQFGSARPPLPLYDAEAPSEMLAQRPQQQFDEGVVVRRVGDMVGRRREQRLLKAAIRAGTHAGVVVHGMGGVGKSTVTAQILHDLSLDGWLVASLYGAVTADDALKELGRRIEQALGTTGEDDAGQATARLLQDTETPWHHRLDSFLHNQAASRKVVFLTCPLLPYQRFG